MVLGICYRPYIARTFHLECASSAWESLELVSGTSMHESVFDPFGLNWPLACTSTPWDQNLCWKHPPNIHQTVL